MTDIAAPPAKRFSIGGLLRKLVAWILVALVLTLAGFAAGWYYFAREISPADEVRRLLDRAEAAADETPVERVARPVTQTAFVTTYHEFPEALTTNLRGSSQFLQLRIGVSTQYDAQVIAHVQTHELALKSDILGVIARFTPEDIDVEGGRDALAAAIRDAINARLVAMEGFGGIEAVFFTAFVRQ